MNTLERRSRVWMLIAAVGHTVGAVILSTGRSPNLGFLFWCWSLTLILWLVTLFMLNKGWKARFVYLWLALWVAVWLLASLSYAAVAFCFGRWHEDWHEAIFRSIFLCTPLFLLYTLINWWHIRGKFQDGSPNEEAPHL